MLPSYQNEKPSSEFKVFCFTFHHLSAQTEFLICCGLVFLFYLLYGYYAELIFTFDGISGWYITLYQFLLYTLFGLIENIKSKRHVPIKIYLLLAFLTLGTMVSYNFHECYHDNVLNLFLGPFKLLIGASQLSHTNYF